MLNSTPIYIFLLVIIFCYNTQQQQQQYGIPHIACPNYFQYSYDGSQYLGIISLPNVGNNVELMVHFSQRTPLYTNYVGRIFPESRHPIKYRVEFPSLNEIPKLTKITVNGQDICLSNEYPAPSTRLFLNHSLRITTRIQTFTKPEASIRPQAFSELLPQTQPVTDDFNSFIPFRGTSPKIYPHSLQSFQEGAQPSQHVSQFVRKSPQFSGSSATTGSFNQPAAQNGQCGEEASIAGFVFGGEEVSRGQFPWLTAIYHKQAGLRFLCAGTLVSARTVVTAGHCFKHSRLSADRLVVDLGRHNLEDYSEQGYVTREIQKLIIHPEYDSMMLKPDADLAILHLRTSVQYTNYIRPICLWTESSDINRIVGQTGVVAGWGADETGRSTTAIPKKVNTNIVSDTECLRSSQTFSQITSGRTFCAGNRDGTGPCMGDSGSGLMLYRNGRWYLRGVVSAGQMKQHTCDLHEFVIFCDVAKHLQWVQSQMVS